MTKYSIPAVTVAAIVTGPIAAHAVTIDFSFTGTKGGTVTGYLDFGSANGSQQPTDLYISTAPANFPASFDLFAAAARTSGAFSLSNGNVIAARYNLVAAHTSISFNNSQGYNTYYQFFPVPGHRTYNQLSFDGVTYTAATAATAAPEPASIALLGAGLAGISTFRRRRART